MEATKETIASPPLLSPSTLASPKTLTSPVSQYSATTKTKASAALERKGTTTSPRTPGPSPFDPYSPINKRPNTLSRTQTQTTGGIFTPRGPNTANQSPSREPVDETARTNALWAEMRATLAEVELSAAKGSDQQTHFFGPQHAKALEELRNAQISLAQAWARADGDAGDEVVNDKDGRTESVGDGVSPGGSVRDRDDALPEDKSRHRSSVAGSASASMDASSLAAERDIAAARLRREANDRYFYRVSKGVMDVVGKLEEVATAMGKVEKESRSVWSDDEDSDSESQSQSKDAKNGKQRAEKQPT